MSEPTELTDEYLLQLWTDVKGEASLTEEAICDVAFSDVPKLISEIWRLRTELAKAEGFSKGLLEGVEWLKRDNEAMRRLMSEAT